jgi:hypothetical protein
VFAFDSDIWPDHAGIPQPGAHFDQTHLALRGLLGRWSRIWHYLSKSPMKEIIK